MHPPTPVPPAARIRLRDDRRFLLWAALAGVVTLAIALVLGTGGRQANLTFANFTQIAAPLTATLMAWQAAGRAVDRQWRRGWVLIGASTLSWCIGQCIWTWYESVQGVAVPFPSLADVGYLLAVPLAAAGLLLFPSAPQRITARTRALLDALIVAGSVLFVSWVFVLGPSFADSNDPLINRAISIAYPASDVVLITIVFFVLSRATATSRVPLGLVGWGYAIFAIADSAFIYTTLNDSEPSPVSNTGWVLGYLLVALGAYFAARHPAEVRADEHAAPTRFALLLPYVPLAAVLIVAAGHRLFAQTAQIDAAEFWIGIGLIAMLLARQAIVLTDNAHLTRSLAESMARLEHQALHDSLTGLPNRALFQDRLAVALNRMQRNPELVAVMFLDLDRFKPINDQLGHKAGDLVLETVADRISRALRTQDTVARFGGDEFIVLCEDVGDTTEAEQIARRVADAVATTIAVGGVSVRVTCSVGVVLTDNAETPADELLRLADHTMYGVKASGRGGVAMTDVRIGRRGSPVVRLRPHGGGVHPERTTDPTHLPGSA